jgi:DNA polymerase I-like protein with 3'-5' exonuclease and polymerase domains
MSQRSLIIPENINKLSMAEAFCFYRDELAWQVYPVHPPWAKVGDPGKQPAVKAWWNFDPHDCDVDAHFSTKRPFNIGLAPKNGLVMLDLDSKVDKGASVQKFLSERPDLANTPRQQSRNGAHLAYVCPDLPKFTHPNGKPYYERLVVTLKAPVTAELFYSDHSNIIIPPSRHPLDDFIYLWTLFGEILEVTWKWLQETYGFSEPVAEAKPTRQKTTKADRWFEAFKGDLASLDLLGLLESLGRPARLLDADEGKYAILCPWESGHTVKKDQLSDTSTVVWQRDESWPGFNCKHNFCAEHGLKELLEWAESQQPGIVDKFCAQQRVWQKGQKNRQGLPRVLHANGRLESKVYQEIGAIMGLKHDWFVRGEEVTVLRKVPVGFVYSPNPATQYSVTSFQVGLAALSAFQAKSSLEKYMEPGYVNPDTKQFVPCSFPTEFCKGLLQAQQLKDQLFHIVRVLPVPLPFRVDDKLLYPKPGYDPQFGTYLLPDAPTIKTVTLEYALEVLERLHSDFCFTNQQSKTHAMAALLTPFAKGIIGWTTRTPLWYYSANRPRAGKDYLRAITLIVYEGIAFEDLPIGKEAEETSKRIMAAARSGRRFMHFSNCQDYLEDRYLTQALTNPVINGRRLGSNDASSDLSVPNEIDFSLSANVGHTYREDFEPRMRKIELAYFEEDPNERTFKDKFLHRTVKENRGLILSSIAALFNHWASQGFPVGPNDFISYPQWAETIGGVMTAAGLADPCLPFKSDYDTGGDLKTAAMTALFRLCFKTVEDAWVTKKQIYQAIEKVTAQGEDDSADTDALRWFGSLQGSDDALKNQTKLGRDLRIFKNRILGGIKLLIDESNARADRHKFRFQSLGTPKNPKMPPDKAEKLEGLEGLEGSSHPSRKASVNPNCEGSIKLDLDVVLKTDSQNLPNLPTLDVLSGGFLALDLETCGEVRVSRRGTPKISASGEALNPWKGEIRLVTIADGKGAVGSFDLREGPLPEEIRAGLERCPLIIHNACFDLLFLKVRLGIVPTKVFCTMTASRLLTPSRSVSHSLGATLERYLGVKLAKEHGGSDWGAFMLTAGQLAYAHDDLRYLHRLEATLRAELENSGLEEIFSLETNLIPIVVAMEHHGFAADCPKLEEMRKNAALKAAQLAGALRDKFNLPTLNPDSPSQLLEAFKATGIELAGSDETTLSATLDERARLILDYRAQAKLEDSIKGLLKVAGSGGRIHARFSPTGALSGRFSSKGPNLQNVTRGALRSCFVPSAPDRCLIVADYSQIELRIGAHFAGDQAMLKAFRAKKDLHRATAAAVLSKPLGEITKDDRQLAKAVNFGFLYGQGAKGFQQYARTEYGIVLSLEEATELRDKFFARYVGLAKWHQEAWEKAQKGISEARTPMGRLLLAQGDRDWDTFQVHTNYVVQGSAADIVKLAMVKTVAVLPSDVHLAATVHDELIFDAPRQEALQYQGIITAAMKDAFTEVFGPDVPIEVEAKVVSNWGEK